MTKAQRERAELLALKHILKDSPALGNLAKEIAQSSNPELKDVITPVIEQKLSEAQLQGIKIGWAAFAIQAIEHIKNTQTVEEIKQYFENESSKFKEKLNIKDFLTNQMNNGENVNE